MAGTCRIPNMVAFIEGHHNGESYDESDIDELVNNFTKYRGYYEPYVGLGHAQFPEYAGFEWKSFGDVTAARKGYVRFDPASKKWVPCDRGPGSRAALILDAENVPVSFGRLIKERGLPRRSIEMFDHTYPLPLPDGRREMTNVLKCVSFLGSRPECVKGMPPAEVVFADLNRVTRPVAFAHRSPGQPKFFGDTPMDPTVMDPPADAVATPMSREQLIQMFADKGIDTSLITEAVPDALLQAMADLLTADPPPAAPVLDAAGDADMVKAFGDNAPTVKAVLANLLKRATAPLAPALAHARTSAANAKAAKIKAFGDRMTGATGGRAYMTPVQFAALKPTLAVLDDSAVKTFADKTTGTALDGQLAALSAAFTSPVKTFGDRIADPLADSKGMPSPERRAELLKHTAVGRAVLKAETATATAKK